MVGLSQVVPSMSPPPLKFEWRARSDNFQEQLEKLLALEIKEGGSLTARGNNFASDTT